MDRSSPIHLARPTLGLQEDKRKKDFQEASSFFPSFLPRGGLVFARKHCFGLPEETPCVCFLPCHVEVSYSPESIASDCQKRPLVCAFFLATWRSPIRWKSCHSDCQGTSESIKEPLGPEREVFPILYLLFSRGNH